VHKRKHYSNVTVKGFDGLNPLDVVCYVGESGVSEKSCSTEIMENGDVLGINESSGAIKGKVKTSDIYVDSESIGEVGSLVIKDRRDLSDDGLLSVIITIDQEHREVICSPNIVSKGFIYVKDHQQMIKDMLFIQTCCMHTYLHIFCYIK